MGKVGSSDGLLVVLGATGTQGGAVLRYYAHNKSQSGFRLRGITRDLESQPAKDLRALGVEMVQADLDNLSSLQRAFSGATHIFATTDSNRLIFNAIKHPEILGEGQTPRTYARDMEERQGKNIADATAATDTLKRIVWSSLPSPKKWSKGRYTKVTMFDAKENIADMLSAKVHLRDKLSVLLIGFYAVNALRVPEFYAPKKQRDGVYELVLPMSGDVQVPHADVESDTGKWASALFEAAPGITLVGSSELLSWKEWLQMWGSYNQVDTRFREASPEEYASKAEGISDAITEEFQFMEQYGFTGGNPEAVYPEDLRRMGISIDESKMLDQIQSCDWSSIL